MKHVKYTVIAAGVVLGLMLTSGAKQGEPTFQRARIYDSPEQVSPILVGTQIPNVPLQDVDGGTVQLADRISQKPAVVIFYRGGWCVYCNRQLGQLMEIEDEILAAGFQIIAISPDNLAGIQKSYGKHQMNYTLLSDSSAEAAKGFGIAYRVDDSMQKKLAKHNIDINKASGYDHAILPVPAVFVIDGGGMVTFEYVNPAYATRLHPSVLLAAVKAESANSK